ncbi:MAG: DUF421 domain-containing protein [Sphingobacteriales bacterium]|nr:MAG: DUF421 domain-containing protein [Sphingobacteriales bacterium]
MKPEEISFGDWSRILLGEVPGSFYIEIVIRTVLSYMLLILALRILGKRMDSQLDRLELAALVTLAAATGVPLQSPERGMIPAVIIAIVVVSIGKLLARLSYRKQRFEKLTHGDTSTLVQEGYIHKGNMEKNLITRERLLAELRSEQLIHLGQLKRVYLEAGGDFTIVPALKAEPGLCIIPDWDKEFISELDHVDVIICYNCGHKQEKSKTCGNCGDSNWIQAVRERTPS